MTNSTTLSLSSEKRSALLAALESERDQRLKANRLSHYKPYPKQKAFHDFGRTCRQRLLRAGNQQGKTFSGAMEMAMHLTGLYPAWWQGRRFEHPVSAWAACDTGETTRDNPQRALMGPQGQWGTGAIPQACLIETKRGQGVGDLIDTVMVRHVSGGISLLGFKRYDQGRQAWQGPAKDVIWCDEEPPADIYDEALARLIATDGMVFTTFTPLRGMSRIVTRLVRAHDGVTVADVNMTLAEALHIAPERHRSIIEAFPEHERDARIAGIPVLGSGRVFPLQREDIRCQAFDVPQDWPVIGGMDFGWDHPFAAVKLAWDRDGDCVYVTQAHRVRRQTPASHASTLRRWGDTLPWAWPHDGLATDKGSGRQLMAAYAEEGLAMLPVHATHVSGGNSVEPGILDMLGRMRTSRLKVFEHLGDWFQEFDGYHRDNGLLVKRDDDLISATRIAIMMLRHARPPGGDDVGTLFPPGALGADPGPHARSQHERS